MPGYVIGGNSALKPPADTRVFGVRWEKTKPSTKLIRTNDSVGYTFQPAIGTTQECISDFDNEPIYRDIRVCHMVDGTVMSYEGEPGFTRTPLVGDIMVEIPKYYYRIIDDEVSREYIISNRPQEGFSVSPRHAAYGEQPERDKIYASAYTLDSEYRSISGATSVTSMTRAETREGCKGRGLGYYQTDFATFWTIAILYLVEVADWDSQTAVGRGFVDGNSAPVNTGRTNNIAGHSGRDALFTSAGQNCVKYRGLENLWGNLFYWCDGFTSSDRTAYISIDPALYADDTEAGNVFYITKASGIAYISALSAGNTLYPWIQVPTDLRGSETTYIPDEHIHAAGWRVFGLGGSWVYGSNAGLFSFYLFSSSSAKDSHASCRLLYLPN